MAAIRRLTLASVENCITAAYNRFATRTQGNFTVATENINVPVTVVLNGGLWNCGFPGYNMAESDINGLRNWCITHPGGGCSYGFRGHNQDHPDSVNVILTVGGRMFNFHVYTAI